MDSHQTIDVIQRALTERKDLGDKSVTIDSLEGFLEALKRIGQLQSPEQYLQSEEHTHQWGVEMVRSGIEAGAHALKTCLLISGGSAAALLAFAGSAWSALKPAGIEALSKTMMYLGIAILLTGLARPSLIFLSISLLSASLGMSEQEIVANGLRVDWCWQPIA